MDGKELRQRWRGGEVGGRAPGAEQDQSGIDYDQIGQKRKWEFPQTQCHNKPLLTARRQVGSSRRGLPGDDEKGREGTVA